MDKEKWITVKGRHIQIKEGESVKDAIKQAFTNTKVKARANTVADKINKQGAGIVKNDTDISTILGREYVGYKGQNAIDKLLQEKQGHIKGAFKRDDIGEIDLLWGNDELGLQHIISRREEQGIDVSDFISDIAEVVEKGNFERKNERGRFEFQLGRKIVIISPEIKGNKLTFLLTAYKTRAKK